MTFAAVGSGIASNTGTFSLTPAAVGNFVIMECICNSTANSVTALSSTNATWSQLVAPVTVGTVKVTVFIGIVTAASTATVTLTISGSTPTTRSAGHEYSTTGIVGNVLLDSSGTVNGTGGLYPSLTPAHGSGELYFGYAFNSGTGAVAGSTTGYTYFVDPNFNGACWNAACTASAQQPAWNDTTNSVSGVAVLLYEAAFPGQLMAGML